jgi:hypothetical protein
MKVGGWETVEKQSHNKSKERKKNHTGEKAVREKKRR